LKILRLAGALLLFALVVSPQTADRGGNAAADPVIRVDVNLRQVDLIVTDAKGNHVSDLQPTDFQLLEDGKPQRITNFSWVEVTPPPSGARLALLKEKPSLLEWYSGVPRFHKTPGNDILASPAANLRKEEIRRMIAIVAGDPSVGAMARVRKFIDEQIGPGDMVSVRSVQRTITPAGGGMVQVRDSMGIFQQFTNDKRQLDAATERLPRVCTMQHVCLTDVPGAFIAAIRSLQDLPGRKALLFVGRYKGPVDNIISLANRAGVVIYVLDTVGVVKMEAATLEDMVAPDSERLLAEKTGGRRILSTVGFDLTTSFNEVVEDLSGYYLLGYQPAGGDSALKAPDLDKIEARHKIEVKVLRAGLTVRVRDGLMGEPDPVARPDSNPAAQPRGREEILTKALFSVFTQDGIRIRLDPLFAASSPNRKNKRSPFVRALLEIDGRDVTFADMDGGKDGGKKKTVLDVALAVFDADGAQAGAANKAFTLQVSKEKAADLAKASLQYKLDVPLSKPGPYQVRAAVRDAASGEVGSASAFLDIPDFNQSKISLSSLVLSLPHGAPDVPAARPAWNEFAPGATVEYICEVFGLKTPGKPPVPPSVETEVKLYRGGGPVAGIPASPVKIENVGDQSFLTGSMRIPDDLAAGNYTMEVLAYDRLEPSKKKQAAEQWIDVTVVSPQK
jgi:VWFA-related protein